MALPDPIGVQKEVVTLNHEGHAVVLGTAGSGKTTMAVHRAVYLADQRADHSGRVLLLSFNEACSPISSTSVRMRPGTSPSRPITSSPADT
jgi:superfamily I DNA/RNA helicase